MNLLKTNSELFLFLNTIILALLSYSNSSDFILLFLCMAGVFSYIYETTFLKIKYLFAFVGGVFINEIINNSRFLDLPFYSNVEKFGFVATLFVFVFICVALTLYIVTHSKISTFLKL